MKIHTANEIPLHNIVHLSRYIAPVPNCMLQIQNFAKWKKSLKPKFKKSLNLTLENLLKPLFKEPPNIRNLSTLKKIYETKMIRCCKLRVLQMACVVNCICSKLDLFQIAPFPNFTCSKLHTLQIQNVAKWKKSLKP